MALQVKEIWPGRRGRRTSKGVKEYTRVFRVIVTGADADIKTGAKAIRNAAGIPRIGDTYEGADGETDISALCNAVEPENTDQPHVWTVTVEYSTRTSNTDPTQNSGDDSGAGGSGSGGSQDPTLRPPKISWGQAHASRSIVALGGRPLCNSAGQPFMPPPEIDVALPVLRITKNMPTFDAHRAATYTNAINASSWTILGETWAPYEAKCTGITGESEWEGTFAFVAVTYEFTFAPDFGWLHRPLDYGSYETDHPVNEATFSPGAGFIFTQPGPPPAPDENGCRPKLKLIQDASGTPIADEFFLDGHGKKLKCDGNGDLLPPHFLEFHIFREVDFDTLGLGTIT